MSGECRNCGAPLAGAYCASCGQKAELHRTIHALMHDLLHGALHFEGKIWHTLPLLAWKPGALTRRYIEGERAKFVSPMALFLFSVFLMFAVFQAAGLTTPTDFGEADNAAADSFDPAELEEQLSGLRRLRSELEEKNAAAPILDRQIQAIEQRIGDAVRAERGEPEVLVESTNGRGRLTAQKTGWTVLDRGIDKWRENPGLMAYKLQANSYKFSWLLIPLSIPFVWLLFLWRRQFAAYDHAVFVTYSLSFMTLLFIVLSVLGALGITQGWLLLALTIIAPLHLYKQLRGTYSLSRFSTAWRLVMLTGFILIILAMFLQLLLVLGAF